MKDRNKVYAQTATHVNGVLELDSGAVEETYINTNTNTQTPPPWTWPWIVRKRMVVLTLGLIAYTGYVYVVRLCIPMIQGRRGAQEDRETGVFLLGLFWMPYLWVIWAYMKVRALRIPPGSPFFDDVRRSFLYGQVILTPPGYAKDYVPRTERPSSLPDMVPFRDLDQSLSIMDGDDARVDVLGSSSGISKVTITNGAHIANHSAGDLNPGAEETETGTSPEPPSTPVLLPAYRYCSAEQLVKPFRADHCPVCDMCVLRYDHHCSWIGQCVGAHNLKYFINFLQAGLTCTSMVLGTLVVFILRRVHTSSLSDVDPHTLILTLLAGLSSVYVTRLWGLHSALIILGKTTPESLAIQRLEDRIDIALAQLHPSRATWTSAQRRAEWEREWGSPRNEGNTWWRANTYEEWTDVMGKSWLGWILPIGRPVGDGLSYPVNPRFDEQGRWRRRSEWPEALR